MAFSTESPKKSVDDDDSECSKKQAVSQSPNPVRAAEVLRWLAYVEPYAFLQEPKIRTVEQAEDSDKTTIDATHTASSLSDDSDLSFVNKLTVKGLLSFGNRKSRKKITGESSFLHYKYALALMYEVRLPGEDLMKNVPKELDYKPIVDDNGSIAVSRRDDNFLECYDENTGSPPPMHRITSFLVKMMEESTLVS